jgi:hypothetical protein
VFRRLAALATLLLLFGAAGARATSPEPRFNRALYVVNNSSVVGDAELADDLPAFQAGVEDFERSWGGSVQLVLTDAAPARAWTIKLLDDADVVGALGYHSMERGVPYARVFAKTSADYGFNWTVTFTHEVFELLADPHINRAVLVKQLFYLVEVADPVEAEQFAYTHPAASGAPVAISDFVTDLWYRRGLRRGSFDFTGQVRHSLQLLTGGYVSYWDGFGWAQRFAQRAHRRRPLFGIRPVAGRSRRFSAMRSSR